ncbi:MAG: hypothetical protein ACI311_02210 [Bacilli bacterium]
MKVTQQPITTNKMANNQKDKPIKVIPTLAKTLINNDSCVVAATKFPWWIALIVYIFSVCISFIPSVVQSGTTKGNYLLTSTMYSADVGLETFTRILNGEDPETRVVDPAKEINLVVKQNEQGENELFYNDTASLENWNAIVTSSTDEDGVSYSYYEFKQNTGVLDSEGNVVIAPRLRVFVSLGEKEDGTSSAYETFFNNPIFGISQGYATENAYYQKPCSLLVFGSKEFYFVKYDLSATSNGSYTESAYKGDYLTQDVGSNGLFLKDLLKSTDSEEVVSLSSSRWNTFFEEGYRTLRKTNTLYSFALVGGMNATIIIIFGATLWLMTRGKNNPNRHFKFKETMNMSFYTALSPAVLTLIFGFIFSRYASFIFVALMAIRLMWMSMKTLRPVQ